MWDKLNADNRFPQLKGKRVRRDERNIADLIVLFLFLPISEQEHSMKAVASTHYLPIDYPASLLDVIFPKPTPQGRDLLIEIKAIAVNPVDTKVRAPKDKVEPAPRVLGWDAAGIVAAVGG